MLSGRRVAAVKYVQSGGPDELFSAFLSLSPLTNLADDANRLLDGVPIWNVESDGVADFGQPACIWPARNGWLIVQITTEAEWRDFCATFLNSTIRRHVPAHAMWHSLAVHNLASTILSTHNVKDAVATCQLYEIPAAVLSHQEQDEAEKLSHALEWAVISVGLWEVQNIFNQGVSNG